MQPPQLHAIIRRLSRWQSYRVHSCDEAILYPCEQVAECQVWTVPLALEWNAVGNNEEFQRELLPLLLLPRLLRHQGTCSTPILYQLVETQADNDEGRPPTFPSLYVPR